jgi:hypothetical protein
VGIELGDGGKLGEGLGVGLALVFCGALFDWAYTACSLVAMMASIGEVSKSSSSMVQSVVFIYHASFEIFVRLKHAKISNMQI